MINRRNILFVLMLFLMILSACAPQVPTASPQPGGAGGNGQPSAGATSGGMVTKDKAPFALAAKAALSQKLSIPADQVSFVSADSVDWSDSCLGLGGPAESCAQMITPGYNVTLKAKGVTYEVHTDEAGSAVRIKE